MSPESPNPEITEPTEYNADVFKVKETREQSAAEIKKNGGYDKKTPEWRKTLSDYWISRAKLTPNMKEAIYKKIGITEGMDVKARDAKIKDYQGTNKIISDGTIGPQMLENLENEIGEDLAQEQEDTSAFNPYTNDSFKEVDRRMTVEEKIKAEENDKKEQEQEWSKIEWVLNRGEDVSTLGTDYEYTLKWSQLTRSDDTNWVNETWNDIRKTWETKEGKEESDIDDLTQTTKGILDKYGEATSKDYKKLKNYKLGELKNADNGDLTQRREIELLEEKIKPLIAKNPKMAGMTLEQFQNLQEKPDSFATSDLVPRDGTAVSPEEFGLKPDGYKYSYANANRNTMVARPTWEIKKGKELDQIKVKMGGEEEFRTQREFLVTRARQIPAGQKFDLPGSPELSYQKTDTWDMQVYKKGNTIGDNGPLYTYNAKDKNWTEKTQWSIGQLAGSGLDFNGNGNTETPETKTASGWIIDGEISMAQK